MTDLFLADAHLLDPQDANYRAFVEFLRRQEGEIRTLYLLGDIFEFWVGYDHVVFANYIPALEALQRLVRAGTGIVWVEGNHDFHLGPYIRDTLRAEIVPASAEATIAGRRVHLCHGDLIDPGDTGYRLYRAVLRNRFVKAVVPSLVTPDRLWRFSRYLSARSKGKRRARPVRDPRPLIRAHAAARFAAGCAAVVSGHFHTPFIEETAAGTIVSLGDWIEQYSYALCRDGVFSLHRFTPAATP